MKPRYHIITAAAGLVCARVLAGCNPLNLAQASSAGVKAIQAATISDSYVQSMAHQYVQQLDAQSNVAGPNDPYTLRLNRIVAPIAGSGYNFKVYLTPDVNAFAVADGSIRVYSGLMDIMTDAEVLGVIGHEIGHVMNKDTKDAFRHALLTSAVRDGLSATGGVVGALSSSELGDITEALSSSQYSQKQELEADDYGYRFLVSHGVNPWVLAMSFEKLEQMQGGGSSASVRQMFSTHPDIRNRVSRVEQRAAKDGYTRPSADGSLYITTPSGSGNTTSGTGTSGQWTF
ncbi:MAG: M48 family metallopeptidase [Rikenellaceae bacterium]|nr:M48 family metallopeptidase [Rikenellaceae bacterium]